MGEDLEILDDSENFRSDNFEGVTYEQLVLEQIRRCAIEGSKEMGGGYFKEKQTNQGMVEVYVPDQREVYSSCVKVLFDMLMPHFDKKMFDDYEKYKKNIKTCKDNKIESLKLQLKNIHDPKIKQELTLRINTRTLNKDSFEYVCFVEEQLTQQRNLFESLMLLYRRSNHLKAKPITR